MHLGANIFVQYPLRLEKVVECLGSGVTVCFESPNKCKKWNPASEREAFFVLY